MCVSERVQIGLHFILNVWLWTAFYTQLQVYCNIVFLHVNDVSLNICSVTIALPPQEKEGQRLSLCVYPQRVDERDGCEESRLARKVWGGWRVTMPLGRIVEARLNGAGAGKVSAQQGWQKRKYHSCMEGRYLTPHSILCSVKREEEPQKKKKRWKWNRGWRC